MSIPGRLTILLLLGALLLPAQYRRHNLTLGMGAARPEADLRYLYQNSFLLNLGYGYRFHRNFQFDAGLDTAFQAGRVADYISTSFGDLRIRDFEFFMPVGGRAILPLGSNRVLLYGGGGVAYLRYSELLRQPSDYFKVDCRSCGSRQGMGYYATTGISIALDRFQMFRVGFGAKSYRGGTDGDPVGAVPRLKTTDRWMNIFGELTMSF